MLVAAALLKSGHLEAKIATVLLWWYTTDLTLTCVFGPSPWSPIGIVCTYIGWRVRGNATFSVPYKVVFAAYLAGLYPMMIKRSSGLSEDELEDNANELIKALAGFTFNSGK